MSLHLRGVTVLAPAYNEEAVVERFVETVLPCLQPDWELLVVDDGSTDRTPEILEGLAPRIPSLRVVAHERNRGLGAALATGFAAAGGGVVVTIDADLSHPVSLIETLVAACEHADAAFASRFIPGGDMASVAAARRWISRVGNIAFRALFWSPVRDLTTGFRAYRSEAVRGLELEGAGFEAQLEIAVRLIAGGARIVEVPLQLRTRAAGRSKMQYLRLIPAYGAIVPRLIRVRWRRRKGEPKPG